MKSIALQILISFLFLIVPASEKLSAQGILVSGRVIEANGNALVGVTVIAGKTQGTFTALNGNWQMNLPAGKYEISFSYVGWMDTTVVVEIKQEYQMPVLVMRQSENTLNEIVVGANRYTRPLVEQTVSMNILHSKLLQNKNLQSGADALDQVPGVTVIDGQAGIRGGAGYAFGAGSRVLIIMDEQPLVTADRNDVKWNFIPIENIDQMEVVKGASSVQYGSAALNGIVNIHTSFPDKTPETKFNFFFTRYDGSISPRRLSDSDKVAFATGGYLIHKHKWEKNDFVFDIYGHQSQSWLQGEWDKRLRYHFKFRHRKTEQVQYGINSTCLFQNTSQFLFWSNDSTGAYHPLQGTTTLIDLKELFVTVDPYFIFFTGNGDKHSMHLRYYHTNQISGDSWQPTTDLLNGDYFFQKQISSWLISSGINGNIYFFNDDALGGLHIGNGGAAFVQIEKKWNRFRIEGGARYELFRIDTITDQSKPVGRLGIQYSANRNLFFRLSFGQGFRVPSPAERFVKYSIGDINIYPNPVLKPEEGWSAEWGIRKQVDNSRLNIYADAAIFMMGYKNMMEFAFGQWGNADDPLIGLGFKALNVNEARIAGIDLSSGAKAIIEKVKCHFDAGYTYTYPIDLQADTTLRITEKFLTGFVNGFSKPDSLFQIGLLRYRNRHVLKFNSDFEWKNITIGAGGRYYSRIDNIDFYFNIFIPGIKSYRDTHLKGDWIFDLQLSYQTSYGKIALLSNNLLNTDYCFRPGKPDAPRNFTLQYSYLF